MLWPLYPRSKSHRYPFLKQRNNSHEINVKNVSCKCSAMSLGIYTVITVWLYQICYLIQGSLTQLHIDPVQIVLVSICLDCISGLRLSFQTKKQTCDRRAQPQPYAVFRHQTERPSSLWLHANRLHVPQYDQDVQGSDSVEGVPESCPSSSCQPRYLGRSLDPPVIPMTCMVWKRNIMLHTI